MAREAFTILGGDPGVHTDLAVGARHGAMDGEVTAAPTFMVAGETPRTRARGLPGRILTREIMVREAGPRFRTRKQGPWESPVEVQTLMSTPVTPGAAAALPLTIRRQE
jgi:hypothetical protein